MNLKLTTKALLITLPFLCRKAIADQKNNYFLFPSPMGQNFTEGETIDVAFTTNFTDPYLSLFCSSIVNPIILERISPPNSNVHPLLLDFAPQPYCTLQIQEGKGPPSTQPSFMTGIFSIMENSTAGANGTNGVVQGLAGYTVPSTLKPPQNCNCVCQANP